jgi:hypothetical protein
MNRLSSIAALLCAAALSACDLFDKNAVQGITGPTVASSRVKFFNFGVSSPGVNFYADNVKMSAISSTRCVVPTAADSVACLSTGIESTTGLVYNEAASGGLYIGIDPGARAFTGRIAAATDNGLAISTVNATIDAGKYYSFYQSGIYNATAKTIDAFVVEDVMPSGPIDYAVAHVRFVNAISNGTGDLNLFATNTTTTTESAVGGPTAYKAAGAFMAVPAGTYNFRAAYTGASTNLITRNGLSLVGGRVYTITARGSTATTSTLGLDFTMNQR